MRRIAEVLTKPAKEVQEMIEVYTAIADAEVFDKQVAYSESPALGFFQDSELTLSLKDALLL